MTTKNIDIPRSSKKKKGKIDISIETGQNDLAMITVGGTSPIFNYNLDKDVNINGINPPKPIIVIENKTDKVILVEDHKIYIKNSGFQTINLGDKYRSILFINCKSSIMYIKDKTLSVNCVDCSKCDVYIEKPVICNLALLRFVDGNVHIKDVIPLVNLNLCRDIKLYTKIGLVESYLVSKCMDILYHSSKNSQLRSSIEKPLSVNIFQSEPIILFDLQPNGMVRIS